MDSVRTFSQTLHPSIAPIVLSIGEKYCKTYNNLYHKNMSHKKLEDDDDKIPQSINVFENFKFKATPKVAGSPEFTSIVEETDPIIKTFRRRMKRQVLKVIWLEIQDLQNKIHKQYVIGIKYLAEADNVHSKSTGDFQSLFQYYLKASDEFDFLKYIDLTYDVFVGKYKGTHGLAIFPQPTGSSDDTTAALHRARNLKTLLIGTLVTPIEVFLQQASDNESRRSLQKLHATLSVDTTTCEAQEQMDIDPSTNEGLVKDLITQSTAKATQKLRAELGQIRKLLKDSQVKDSRGQLSGPSQTKEKTQKQQKQDKTSAKNPQADGAAEDTSVSLKKKKKQQRRKKKKNTSQR